LYIDGEVTVEEGELPANKKLILQKATKKYKKQKNKKNLLFYYNIFFY
jgi:hypothetical protein